jgi:hypothetical protein
VYLLYFPAALQNGRISLLSACCSALAHWIISFPLRSSLTLGTQHFSKFPSTAAILHQVEPTDCSIPWLPNMVVPFHWLSERCSISGLLCYLVFHRNCMLSSASGTFIWRSNFSGFMKITHQSCIAFSPLFLVLFYSTLCRSCWQLSICILVFSSPCCIFKYLHASTTDFHCSLPAAEAKCRHILSH